MEPELSDDQLPFKVKEKTIKKGGGEEEENGRGREREVKKESEK